MPFQPILFFSRSILQMAVFAKKGCCDPGYHDNVTSHFSSLRNPKISEVGWKKKYPNKEKDMGIRGCKDMMYEQVERT